MRETQESICTWAVETFGTVEHDMLFRVAVRAQEEFVEFLRSYAAGKPDVVELADTAIILCRLARRADLELDLASELTDRIPTDGYEGDPLVLLVGASITGMTEALTATMMGEIEQATISALLLCLSSLAIELGGDLSAEVDAKMTINRGRKWNLDHTGHGYHVRERELTEV